jgi:putative transposase
MLRFRRMKTLQKFASVHGSVYNHFNQDRHLITWQQSKDLRYAAMAEWKSHMAYGRETPALAPQSGNSFAFG